MYYSKYLRYVTMVTLSGAISAASLAQDKDAPKADKSAKNQPSESEMMAMMMELSKPGENFSDTSRRTSSAPVPTCRGRRGDSAGSPGSCNPRPIRRTCLHPGTPCGPGAVGRTGPLIVAMMVLGREAPSRQCRTLIQIKAPGFEGSNLPDKSPACGPQYNDRSPQDESRFRRRSRCHDSQWRDRHGRRIHGSRNAGTAARRVGQAGKIGALHHLQ